MEYIIILIACIAIIWILFIIFGVNIKKIKEEGENKQLDEIVEKFPENKKICEDILISLKNEKVKIKENSDKENKTSLYIAVSDTIFIANIKDSYTRIQTIAHECLHSIQNRRLLLFNFIYSNIYLIYFFIAILLTIIGVFKNTYLQILILTFMGLVYYVVRSYLETDAMTKARYIAKEYMDTYIKKSNICTKEEVEQICEQYDKINLMGIPATNFILVANCIIKVCIYILVTLLVQLF